MKITSLSTPIDEIAEAGWLVRCEMPASWVAESLLPPYHAESPVALDIEAKRIGDAVHVHAKVRVELGFSCSRTMEPGHSVLELDLHELFERGHAKALNLRDGVDSDELAGDEPYVITDGRLDVEPFLREQIVLAQDPWPTVESSGDADTKTEDPLWSSGGNDVDPRWAKLKDIELS
ncbi:MAG: YceD family protein [Myxococcota bacterium]